MSWSFQFHGKVSAVRKAVEAQEQTFAIEEEQKAYESAKQTILLTLAGTDDSKHVFVNASGSAMTESSYAKRSCSTLLSVSDAPISLYSNYPGEYVE